MPWTCTRESARFWELHLCSAAEAQKRITASSLSKREMIRRLGTSATQFYRLLDQTNYSKSVDQLLSLLHVLDCDVDLQVRTRTSPGRAA